MTDIDHLDFDPVMSCDMAAHDMGRNGCVPEQHALYVVADRHKEGHPRHVVCEGRMIWLRGNLRGVFFCLDCRAYMTIEDRFEFLGRIDAPAGGQK